MSFWNNLPRPFFVMAPMADVTDVAFRALVAARGAPDVFGPSSSPPTVYLRSPAQRKMRALRPLGQFNSHFPLRRLALRIRYCGICNSLKINGPSWRRYFRQSPG